MIVHQESSYVITSKRYQHLNCGPLTTMRTMTWWWWQYALNDIFQHKKSICMSEVGCVWSFGRVILPYKCAVYTDNHDVNNLDNKIQYNINVTVVFDSSCEVKMMIILSNWPGRNNNQMYQYVINLSIILNQSSGV